MKKQLLLLSMISLFTLASCGEKVNSIDDGNGNQVIVKIGDTNYTANDLFKEYSNTSSGASQYFSAIYDVVINAVQPETMSIRKEVSQEINKFYQDAESSAKELLNSTICFFLISSLRIFISFSCMLFFIDNFEIVSSFFFISNVIII